MDISIRKLGRWTFYDRETQKDVKEEKGSEKKSEAHEEKGSEKISKTKEKGKWRIGLFLKKNDICDTDVNGFILHPLWLWFKFPS